MRRVDDRPGEGGVDFRGGVRVQVRVGEGAVDEREERRVVNERRTVVRLYGERLGDALEVGDGHRRTERARKRADEL